MCNEKYDIIILLCPRPWTARASKQEIVPESWRESRDFKVVGNHCLLAKHIVFDGSEKLKVSYYSGTGTIFQTDLWI